MPPKDPELEEFEICVERTDTATAFITIEAATIEEAEEIALNHPDLDFGDGMCEDNYSYQTTRVL